MPILNKQYTLTVTVEQFLQACDDIELQELELLLPRYMQYVKRDITKERVTIPDPPPPPKGILKREYL